MSKTVPLTEPIIVGDDLVHGMELSIVDGMVHFVGYQYVPADPEQAEERRVVIRFAMQRATAEDCCQRVSALLFGARRH